MAQSGSVEVDWLAYFCSNMVHIGPPEKFQRNINQLDVRSKGSKPSVKHLQSLIGRCFALAHIGLAPHSPDPNYDGWHGPCHLSNICISSVTAADQDLTHKHQSLLQHVLSESCQLSCEHSLLFSVQRQMALARSFMLMNTLHDVNKLHSNHDGFGLEPQIHRHRIVYWILMVLWF